MQRFNSFAMHRRNGQDFDRGAESDFDVSRTVWLVEDAVVGQGWPRKASRRELRAFQCFQKAIGSMVFLKKCEDLWPHVTVRVVKAGRHDHC